MQNILHLASKSSSRRFLLTQVKIPFTLIDQSADELACDWGLPIEQVTLTIARSKMAHAVLPDGSEGARIYVLTADTLVQDMAGRIHGKPIDIEDARNKVQALQPRVRVATSYCLHRYAFSKGAWHVQDIRERCVVAECEMCIPLAWVERYFENEPLGLNAAGAMAIEAYGMQFVRAINGSYSTIMGLPLFELREDLEALHFFAVE